MPLLKLHSRLRDGGGCFYLFAILEFIERFPYTQLLQNIFQAMKKKCNK